MLFKVLGGFGFGVLETGMGVGVGVIRGVGVGVVRGVGAGVIRGVAAGVGSAVAMGDPVAAGTGEAAGGVDGDTDGLASIDGDGLATGGLELGGGSTGGEPPGVDVGACVSGTVVGAGDASLVGVGMTATGPVGRADAAACCCRCTPPMPRAIVASTRFRTPRLRMSRTR